MTIRQYSQFDDIPVHALIIAGIKLLTLISIDIILSKYLQTPY